MLRELIAACERAKRLNFAGEWLRPPLLAAAFDLRTLEKAESLADDVLVEGAAAWKIDRLLGELNISVFQVADADKRARLSAVIERIKAG